MTALPFRKVCAWGDPPHPMDGLGPVEPGSVVSHGICADHLEAFKAVPDDAGDPDGDFLGGCGR